MKSWLTFAALAVVATTAVAPRANAEGSRELRAPGSKVVFVWNSAEAQDEGIRLVQGGAGVELIAPLVACVVNNGDRAVITDFGFLSSDIVVISGENTGCRGNVATEYIKAN